MHHVNEMYGEIKLFGGTASPDLANKIADYLGISLCGREVVVFPNDNIFVKLHRSVRGQDCFVIQSTAAPVHRNLMELLIMLQTLRLDSAARITAVIPYLCYARSDKKDQPRVPITARLVADMIEIAGADRYITLDLHAGQIQGFFNIPVDNLFAAPVLISHIRRHFDNDLAIVSPDAGGVERARAFAKRLDADLAIIDKRRSAPNQAKAMAVIGNVRDKVVVILDDMVDTAGTLVEAAEALSREGAREIHACCAHAVLSGPAVDRIKDSALKSVVVTDTIPLKPNAASCKKISVLSISELVGEAIIRSYRGDSVTSLFV
jgi:ribose-phosphate pyrophosphokinase